MNQSGMNLAGKWSFKVGPPTPPNMPTSSMQPTAVANALKGEKSFESVQFPVTGDREIDAISGIRAVLNQTQLHPKEQVRVLEYSLVRAREYADNAQRALESQREAMDSMKQYADPGIIKISPGMVSGLGTAGQAIGASPYPAHSPSSMVMDEAFFRGPDGIANMLGVSKEP